MTRDPDMDLRPRLAAAVLCAKIERGAQQATPVVEREPADEIRQALSVVSLENAHPEPDREAIEEAVRRIEAVCRRLEKP